MAQPIYPWQNYHNDENAASVVAPSAGGLRKKSKKRQRAGNEQSDAHESSQKRHHKHALEAHDRGYQPQERYHPSGIPLPHVGKKPVEVIDLLDDDDNPPSRTMGVLGYDGKIIPLEVYDAPPPHGTQENPLELYPALQSRLQSAPADHSSHGSRSTHHAPPAFPVIPQYDPALNDMSMSYAGQQFGPSPMPRHAPAHNGMDMAGHPYLHLPNSQYPPSYNSINASSHGPAAPPPPYSLVDAAYNPTELSQFRHNPPPPSATHQTDPASDVVPITEPTLCKEQADLVDLILSGRNVFYTGSAGCGKSTVLKAFVKRFSERGMKVNIVAPTGRAALDINGSTTWTYAGWTPDSHKKPLKDLLKGAHGKYVRKRLTDTHVLVIDEVSMIENLHFERLNAVMKEARGDGRAFGGVQLIVTGDFCQLPPVKPFGHCIECGRELIKNREETEYKCRMHGTYYDIDKWAFRSKAWEECNFAHVNLTEIHRQSDAVFIEILQKLRMGTPLSQANIDLLLNHESQTRNAIKLFATREEVKRVNDQMFKNLPTKARTYKCLDHFNMNEKHQNLRSKGDVGADGSLVALREHRYESQIQLKKGMLVVLLHNLDLGSGLVNGSQGTIQGFEDYAKNKMPKAAKKGGRDDPTLQPGIPVLSGDHAEFREELLKLYATQMEYKAWPIVRFLNGVERTIYADCTVNQLGDEAPYSLLSRTQIPLMAAWAMTTHKSQGMTLNRVVVNLARSFEQGQAYVALSRARSLEGLKVESFPASAQGTGNKQVKEFLRDKFGIQ